MTKPARSYYSAAFPHRDLPHTWLASYGIPGKHPQWVVGEDGPLTFPSKEKAELEGYRFLMSVLNGSRYVQQIHTSADRRRQPVRDRKPARQENRLTVESVFKNFR